MRKTVLGVLFVLLLHSAYASLFYDGNLRVQLESDSLKAGDTLKGAFVVTNFEPVAFNDSYIIAELVSGPSTSLGYPSQLSDSGTIFFEKKFDARLLAGQRKTVPFEIALPSNLAPGTYTLDAYFRTERTIVEGIPHLFATPTSVEFVVSGSGDFPQLRILRTATVFNNVAGPIGPPAQPGSAIPGVVHVKNDSSSSLSSVVVWAGLCNWDDTSCEGFLSEDSSTVGLSPGEKKAVGLELIAPETPGAYAIRIEARNSSGQLVSLYRNRSIVVGGTARIRKLDISTQELVSGSKATVNLVLGSTPDHYTNPDFTDFDLRVWVETGGSVISETSQHVDILPFSELSRDYSFSFTPSSFHLSFTVCSSIEKQGKVMDRYCFDVSPIEQPDSQKGGKIRVETDYSLASGNFLVQVCGFDYLGNGELLDAKLTLIDRDGDLKVREKTLNGVNCSSDALRVEDKKYLLIINDFRNKAQFNQEFDFSNPVALSGAPGLTCSELEGTLCSPKQTCLGTDLDSVESGVCCAGSCELDSGVGVSTLPSEVELFMPLALALVILAGLLLIMGRKESHREGYYE